MNLKTTLLSAALAFAALPGFAASSTGTDMIFDRSALANVENGTVLTYSQSRSADGEIPIKPLLDRSLRVTLTDHDDGAMTRVQRFQGKAPFGYQEFPASNGNPIPPIFLNSTVAAVTFATKGSVFYIKNRFQDAIYQGGEVSETEVEIDGETHSATRIVYKPFEGDPNVDKMGRAMAAIEVIAVLSDAVPGKIVSVATRSEIDGVEYFNDEIRYVGSDSAGE